jgi:hypothetical protein
LSTALCKTTANGEPAEERRITEVFSTLATLAEVVREVGVGLARAATVADASTSGNVFACIVSIRLRSGRRMDLASHAQHPYGRASSS